MGLNVIKEVIISSSVLCPEALFNSKQLYSEATGIEMLGLLRGLGPCHGTFPV
jgi:hypothetical protein